MLVKFSNLKRKVCQIRGDFDETYQLVLEGCQKWLEQMKNED